MTEDKPKIALQTITIANPLDQTRQAVLNIWFIGKDIVIGGIGWYEYYDYEKLHAIPQDCTKNCKMVDGACNDCDK